MFANISKHVQINTLNCAMRWIFIINILNLLNSHFRIWTFALAPNATHAILHLPPATFHLFHLSMLCHQGLDSYITTINSMDMDIQLILIINSMLSMITTIIWILLQHQASLEVICHHDMDNMTIHNHLYNSLRHIQLMPEDDDALDVSMKLYLFRSIMKHQKHARESIVHMIKASLQRQ